MPGEGDEDDDTQDVGRPAALAKPEPSMVHGAPPGAGGPRYFEFVEGSSSKFWEIALDGSSFTTRYGKIGTDGQQSLKEYDSPARALTEYQKLITEKTKKGYLEKTP